MTTLLLFALFVADPDVKDPVLRKELLAKMMTDQAARMKLIEAGNPPPARELKALVDIDAENRAWLKGVIEKHGWPGKTLVGEDGAHAAWLLVQHADADVPFQRKCLDLLKDAVKAREATGTDLAYLTDRVLVAEGKKQLYGTQLEQKDGKLIPKRIENPDEVDNRRKEVGLMPMAEYLGFASKVYKVKAIPVRKPEIEAVIVKVVPATDAEKDKGVLVTVFLKDRDGGVPVTKDVAIHKQMGKLVPQAEVGDLKEGVKVSLWVADGKAEAVLIFP
jgi:hypothetical protein